MISKKRRIWWPGIIIGSILIIGAFLAHKEIETDTASKVSGVIMGAGVFLGIVSYFITELKNLW